MTSGLIDNNDFTNASDSRQRTYLGRVKDARLREQLLAAAARIEKDPAAVVSETWWVGWAAWQPLLFEPGAGHHYSNIGYDILGLIAARAGGKPLPVLYRERIFEPLGLDATAYDPQGLISRPARSRLRDRTRRQRRTRRAGTGASEPTAASSPTPRTRLRS